MIFKRFLCVLCRCLDIIHCVFNMIFYTIDHFTLCGRRGKSDVEKRRYLLVFGGGAEDVVLKGWGEDREVETVKAINMNRRLWPCGEMCGPRWFKVLLQQQHHQSFIGVLTARQPHILYRKVRITVTTSEGHLENIFTICHVSFCLSIEILVQKCKSDKNSKKSIQGLLSVSKIFQSFQQMRQKGRTNCKNASKFSLLIQATQ